MNVATLAAVSLYFSPWRHAPRLVVLGSHRQQRDMATFQRMVRAWTWVEDVDTRYVEELRCIAASGDTVIVALSDALPSALPAPADARTVLARIPSVEDEHFGFCQELASHDFELGGVNEWREDAGTSYSPNVLQSLSLSHVHRSLP